MFASNLEQLTTCAKSFSSLGSYYANWDERNSCWPTERNGSVVGLWLVLLFLFLSFYTLACSRFFHNELVCSWFIRKCYFSKNLVEIFADWLYINSILDCMLSKITERSFIFSSTPLSVHTYRYTYNIYTLTYCNTGFHWSSQWLY